MDKATCLMKFLYYYITASEEWASLCLLSLILFDSFVEIFLGFSFHGLWLNRSIFSWHTYAHDIISRSSSSFFKIRIKIIFLSFTPIGCWRKCKRCRDVDGLIRPGPGIL